ncbi:hypothetical protein SAMN04489798_1938 [Pseudomonas arsenicoxydans]|uniref:Uncharacterized protein n=1 Tax=Pseudomonas arsenicoxydans TaxID=702115 RepID=A0A1H0GLD3_9PSED|nr:hypothetical protein SAMN04489798_1938 [Pseudomonas arsenicoxydans]
MHLNPVLSSTPTANAGSVLELDPTCAAAQ